MNGFLKVKDSEPREVMPVRVLVGTHTHDRTMMIQLEPQTASAGHDVLIHSMELGFVLELSLIFSN